MTEEPALSRYVDIWPQGDGVPAELVLGVGDVVRLAATGCRVVSGTAVELVGILTESVVGTDGSIVSPMGVPGTVLLRATEVGQSVVDVFTGDPFGSSMSHTVTVRVEP
jgi:protein involved in polysaccharide export with SLBB domain